jgi:hypothetical protein
VPGSSLNHCFSSTRVFAVDVASSYNSSEMATMGTLTCVRSIRAGMKPPPPIATMMSGSNARTRGTAAATVVAICAYEK